MYKFIVMIELFSICLFAQSKTIIQGTVTDQDNSPLPYVNVFLLNTTDGSMSGADGHFKFSTSLTGSATLRASMVGYKKYSTDLNLGKVNKLTLNIVLSPDAVQLSEAVVTASSFGSEKEKGLVVSRLDVLTTPGGAADIYQSLKTMPGLTQVSESAELYIRGGDPIESLTMINQTAVYHPYTFESAYGGIFSNLNQSMLKSMYFTSGGFSAKYGNVLSGVLDIETKDLPERTDYNLGLSMANGNLSSDVNIIPGKLGLYFDAIKSFTSPIFWLNGGEDRLALAPTSKNITGGIIYNYSKTGKLKFFTIAADDEEGVKIERAEYVGNFNGNTKNTFFNLQHSDILLNDIVVKTSLGYNKFSNRWMLGILDLLKTDYVYSLRNDIEIIPAQNLTVLAGFEYEIRKIKYEGSVPEETYDIRPDASATILDALIEGSHYALYSEIQKAGIAGIKSLSATAGIRYDNIVQLKSDWIDTRLGAGYKINDKFTLRAAWGKFRQMPDPRLYSAEDGNPNLKPMSAEHIIGSIDYQWNEQNNFRIEVYRKIYKDLPLENNVLNYDNSGHGYANGIDIIYKGEFDGGISGWISYGYINTKRLWMDFDQYAASSYDITHNFSIVAKYSLSEKFQIGVTAKYATGRPYTPVISSEFRPDQNIFEPLYASTNSSRFPDYKRVDMRLTYFSQLFDAYSLVAFCEAINILNFENIFGYSYSPDYRTKKEIESYFGRRMLVFGFSVNF